MDLSIRIDNLADRHIKKKIKPFSKITSPIKGHVLNFFTGTVYIDLLKRKTHFIGQETVVLMQTALLDYD